MKYNKLWILTVSLVFMMVFGASAQSKPQRTAKKPQADAAVNPANEEKVRDLIAFLQLLLNTLGSGSTSARDKDIVITESYAKIFRDSKVQIEDDLAETRSTITNKDVVAYLKDVDFFFGDVSFELTIDDIKQGVSANGQVFYRVSLRRTLTGTTITGKKITNTMPRYVEVNYDPDAADLKIVSIYTNEFDEKEALTNWWKGLSYEWQSIFRRKLNLRDSVDLDDIKDMTSLQELDLSGNEYIQTIEPLGQLISLKLLNLSGTNVEDITPIRNLNELVELDISRTKVFDLTPLRYATRLTRLNINNTEVRSLAFLEKMTALQILELQGTHAFDFEPLTYLTSLVSVDLKKTVITSVAPLQKLPTLAEINIAQTNIKDLSPLQGLKNLASLNIDSTLIRDIGPLRSTDALEVLSANYTFISDLAPLANLKKLQRVYCDNTPIKKPAADAFMSAHPGVLIIFDSKDLREWWSALPERWQRILTTTAGISANPGKEELARLPNLDSINFRNDRSITTLEPLRKLVKLRTIVANNTGITDLSPLQDHRDIRILDISDTEVKDLSPLAKAAKLQILRADRSSIQSVEPLFGLKQLKELYAERTVLHDITAREFLEKNPECLVVYKTVHLERWWSNLDPEWKEVFKSTLGSDTTRVSLHRLVEQEKLHLRDARVNDLSVLGEFLRLRELHFSGTGITTIPELEALRSLKSLHATSSPLQRIGAIALLKDLEDLDISNTPIADLRGLENLEALRSLNCSGTQIKKLDALRPLVDLQVLDCSNTRVSKLDPVVYLSLRSLKAYNTKITSREVDKFKGENPDCNVVYYR